MKKTLIIAGAAILLAGCATVSTQSRPYLGVPTFAPADPAKVQILAAEPKERHYDRLGEVILDISGNPSKDRMENKLKAAAAKLGAEAVFVVHDQMRVFPVVYVDWWGPMYSQETRRGIVAVAIKFK
jgi:hypothetical protein